MNELSYLTRLLENVELPIKPDATASSINIDDIRH